MSALYVDPNRKTGSQSEVPTIRHEQEFICFDGYQRYRLSANRIEVDKQDHRKKYGMVRPYLLKLAGPSTSVMDLGCSAGVMGFQVYLDGIKDVIFVDHDPEYLDLVRAGVQHIGATRPRVQESKVQDLEIAADVLFAFAIIHWLYSCTEDFGSLDRIVEKLARHGTNTMFIEWVGPECKDIQGFGHLDRNTEIQTDSYTRDKFIHALEKRYPHVKRIGLVRQGREIWMASKTPCSPGILRLFAEKVSYSAWLVSAKFSRLAARLSRGK